ncbi:MAG: hypothetical protein JXP34_28465 [Planctomycetes bacterium]|nr:hypothetical protein [Planctomycetota bacterium]
MSGALIRDGIAREILGVRIRVAGPVPRELADLLQAFPSPAPEGRDPGIIIRLEPLDRGFRIRRGSLRPVESDDPSKLLPALDWAVLDAALALATGVLRIHAGAVAAGAGGLLLPAEGEAGKTTLVLELCRSGAAYLSDDVGVIDLAGAGRLIPFPKSLRLRRWNAERLDAWHLLGPFPGWTGGEVWYAPPVANGLAIGEAVPVSAIIFPRYEAGLASAVAVRPLRKSEAFLRLFRQEIGGDDLPLRGFEGLSRLAGTVPAHEVLFRDTAAAAARILALATP